MSTMLPNQSSAILAFPLVVVQFPRCDSRVLEERNRVVAFFREVVARVLAPLGDTPEPSLRDTEGVKE